MAVKGAEKHLKRMAAMGVRARKEAEKLVYVLADMHVAEASQLITEGAVSGAGHAPSAPGQPPNEDTGTLRRSGHVERTGPLVAKSVFDAPYAAALEFGTSKMAERPFARPAARAVRKEAKQMVKAVTRRITSG